MSDWGVGYASGIVVGLVIGLIVGRKRQTWSEMSSSQRKVMISLIAAGVVLLAAGIVVFFLVSG